jgi:hypothetical protein
MPAPGFLDYLKKIIFQCELTYSPALFDFFLLTHFS